MRKSEAAIQPDMPDIAKRALNDPQAKLNWVGMSNLHQPLLLWLFYLSLNLLKSKQLLYQNHLEF